MGFVELIILDCILNTTCIQMYRRINVFYSVICCMEDAYLLIIGDVYGHVWLCHLL